MSKCLVVAIFSIIVLWMPHKNLFSEEISPRDWKHWNGTF